MYIKNIREIKKDLRAQSRKFRDRMPPEQKASFDRRICSRFFGLREYAGAELICTYVSKPIEVDTAAIIARVLADGKRVAVPRCLPETLGMQFYEISSMDDLEPGCYSVLEPVLERCRPVRFSGKAICIVPGLCFDSCGYRLGYGKGYYDRFLAGFSGLTVGLCYSRCMRWNLPHGYYDRPVDVLVTEKYIRHMTAANEKNQEIR